MLKKTSCLKYNWNTRITLNNKTFSKRVQRTSKKILMNRNKRFNKNWKPEKAQFRQSNKILKQQRNNSSLQNLQRKNNNKVINMMNLSRLSNRNLLKINLSKRFRAKITYRKKRTNMKKKSLRSRWIRSPLIRKNLSLQRFRKFKNQRKNKVVNQVKSSQKHRKSL